MRAVTRKLWWIVMFIGSLTFIYVLVYAAISISGQYQPISVGGLGHWEEYSVWAPIGFYDPNHSPPGSVAAKRGIIIGTWRYNPVGQVYWPLWDFDTRYVHKTKYLRFVREELIDGKWMTTTNEADSTITSK